MNDDRNPDEPNFDTPPEDFEIVDVEQTPDLTDEQRQWPVVDFVQAEDFAIEEVLPVLVLTPAAGHESGTANGVPANDRVAALVEAVSAYEQSLGGEGLHVFDPVPPVGPDRIAL